MLNKYLSVKFLALAALVLTPVVAWGFYSFAGTSPTVTLLEYASYGVPGNGGAVTARVSDNKFPAVFRTKANDGDTAYGLKTQVVYRKSTETTWHNFGKTAITGPSGGATVPNGITTNYVDTYGRNCLMGWSDWSRKPVNCGGIAIAPNGKTGLPAFSDFPTYTPTVNLSPGTYYWRARSYDGGLYSGWSGQWSFTIRNAPASSCSLTATPGTIKKGSSAKLTWSTANATRVSSSWATSIGASGSVSFAPASSKTYTITAANGGGSKSCSVRVTVVQPSAPTSSGSVTSRGTAARPKTTVTARPTTSNVNDTAAPTVPEELTARFEAERGSVYLEWRPATDNVEVAGYSVQKREKGQGSWESVVADVFSANYLDIKVGSEKIYEYQVRAFDGKKNYSEWSNIATVSTGPFEPNATVSEGGSIENDDATVLVEVNAGDLEEDLFFSIEPVELIRVDFGKNYRGIGQMYEIKAKNRNGLEVKQFKAPITIKFLVDENSKKEINLKSLSLARSEDSTTTKLVESKYESGSSTVSAEVDHLTPYYVVAKQKNAFLGVMKNIGIVLLVLVVLGLPFAYYYYRRYKQEQSYEEIQNELKY